MALLQNFHDRGPRGAKPVEQRCGAGRAAALSCGLEEREREDFSAKVSFIQFPSQDCFVDLLKFAERESFWKQAPCSVGILDFPPQALYCIGEYRVVVAGQRPWPFPYREPRHGLCVGPRSNADAVFVHEGKKCSGDHATRWASIRRTKGIQLLKVKIAAHPGFFLELATCGLLQSFSAIEEPAREGPAAFEWRIGASHQEGRKAFFAYRENHYVGGDANKPLDLEKMFRK